MLQTPQEFVPLMTAQAHPDPIAFVFRNGKLLVRADDLGLPDARVGLALHGLQPDQFLPVGLWQERYCCTTWVDAELEPQAGFAFVPLRSLFGSMDEALLGLASRAVQLAEWARTHRFCGHCANPMQLASGERAYKCPACGMVAYPRISPAMMVLIKKGDHILLARHVVSPTGRFSALAGFLEAGESIEEAIHREVMEEVGLKVKNLQYFGSQSWPFPHSLMIAFTAEYAGGEITPDASEIAEARWFGPEDVQPEAPPGVSISNRLLNAHWPGPR
ncbi:MAG: NAD(+) diphosphatase [Pseudomonadota bacterium]